MGREEGVEEGVEKVAEDDFVNVERQRVQVEEDGQRVDCIAEGGRNGDRV